MAVKEWFREFQPLQLYIILFFTSTFFLVEIIASYITHSLTLLLHAYYMLCNIIALGGCIASIKYGKQEPFFGEQVPSSLQNSTTLVNEEEKGLQDAVSKKMKQTHSDRRMKSTFGWARIDILTMLVCCVFLASFCFSVVMEAAQTLIHIDHLDAMHHPLPVMSIGAVGVLLHAVCYFLIGGYTFNQGTYLQYTNAGDVSLCRSNNAEVPLKGKHQARRNPIVLPKGQGVRGICRDLLGCVLVMADSLLVYLTGSSFNARFVDPIFAIISSISLFVLSYPYMKESGLILLQTIPNHINIESLRRELLEAFPGIVNVHDLHVWQLKSEKVISTVHIIFLDPMVYANITDEVTSFFIEMGITQVTVQPEFHKMKPNLSKLDCLISCRGDRCKSSQCCTKEKSADCDTVHNSSTHKFEHNSNTSPESR